MRLIKHALLTAIAIALMAPLAVASGGSPVQAMGEAAIAVPVVTLIDIPRSAESDAAPKPKVKRKVRPVAKKKRARSRVFNLPARKRRGSLGMAWPVRYITTGNYGPRAGGFHHGVDLRCPPGRPIQTAKAGRVTFVGRMPIYGGTVIVSHGRVRTLYAHMSARNVRKGQRIGPDHVIGFCGSTGMSFGPHLHFEVYMGKHVINPRRVLPRRPAGYNGFNFPI